MFGYSKRRGGIKHHVGVCFENIRSAANSVYGTVSSMAGLPEGHLRDVVLRKIQNPGAPVNAPQTVLIGKVGNNINPGFTTIWVRTAKQP